MGRVYTYTIAGIPAGQNDRLGWRARATDTKEFRTASEKNARSILNARQGRIIAKARVTFTIIRKGTRPFDPTNCPAHCKVLIDGIVRAGLLKDDSAKYLEMTYPLPQERGPERSVRVQIEEIDG
jgi:hypothetical protein